MKKIFTICFLLGALLSANAQNSATSSVDPRIEFRCYSLGLLQLIAFKTTYDEVISANESKGIEVHKTMNKDKTELLNFKIGDKEINLLYSKDKKLIYGGMRSTITLDDVSGGAKTEHVELRDNNFKKYEVPITMDNYYDPTITYYSKGGYPYQFIIKDIRSYEDYTYIYIFNTEFGSIDKFKNLKETAD